MLCVAITTADTWLGSFIVARTTPYMITGLGYGTYFVFGGVVMLMGIWAFFFVPETKGKSGELSTDQEKIPLLTTFAGVSLEMMDALFAQSTCKTVWAGLRGRSVLATQSDDDLAPQKTKETEAEASELEKQ